MKKSKFILFLALLYFTASQSNATVRVVTVSAMIFTPASMSVSVGDTVKWVWSNGTHTTTSSAVPSGAAPWSAPLDTLHQTFIYVVSQPGTYSYYCLYHVIYGMTGTISASPSGIKQLGTSVPESFNLMQNFPNPFNPTTNIRFDIPENAKVKLVVYDVQGRLAAELIDQQLTAGTYNFDWDASAFPSGVYFYSLASGNFMSVKKLVLVK